MKTVLEILLCISCIYAIFIQLLRIVWLYFPSFKQRSSVYKIKVPGKTEMLLYFILAIVAMAYFIFITSEKYVQHLFLPRDY
ncbi:MAG TPA: hypothetical protein PKJ94_02645 [Ferruginibacter sp.]|nr:hypothetical protein [Ferruginibacter sp.]